MIFQEVIGRTELCFKNQDADLCCKTQDFTFPEGDFHTQSAPGQIYD